jgi:peptidoglycan/LPS O-acetylase OafA/YrhL
VPSARLRTPQPSHLPYRPDIDGLRAVAVLAVVGFHASPRFVPGGFVGVDVFFVISGFLITGILLRDCAAGRFSFADFYARRVRRIFPALVVILLATWAIGWYVLVGDEFTQLEQHIAAGGTFTSNVLLWHEAGYFDPRAELKPLLHLWSLGIEEQFYLVWPPIVYVCWKRKLNILSAMLMIIAASFALNLALVPANSVAAFYLPTSRMWELLGGGLLAYASVFGHGRVDAAVNRWLFSDGHVDERFSANLKACLGLLLLATAVVMLGKSAAFPGWWFGVSGLSDLAAIAGFDKEGQYPGWLALLPTLGTALLIWAGPSAWINRTLLARPALVGLGLISYPLYLWHWPLLSFVGITENGDPSRRLRLYAVLLSFVLAWLTYQFVERPLRRRVSSRTPVFLTALAASLVAIAVVAGYSQARGLLSARTPQFATALPSPMTSPRHDPACAQAFPATTEYCQAYAATGTVTTALLGDSHAEHFLTAVGVRLAGRGENVVHLGWSGCPPLLGIERLGVARRDSCTEANGSMLAFVAGRAAISHVLLSFRGVKEVAGGYTLAGTDTPSDVAIRQALEQTVDFLLAHGKQVGLILQVPELPFDPSQCVGRPFSFERHLRTPCAVPKAEVTASQAAYRAIVAAVQQRTPALVVFDPLPLMCDDRLCWALRDGTLAYVDNNHLSRSGSLMFADALPFF